MTVTAIAPIGTVAPAATTGAASPAGEAPRADFAAWLDRHLQTTEAEIRSADLQVRQLALGETENLHQVMLSLERARLSLELVVQVRNRLLEAYQDVLRMQV